MSSYSMCLTSSGRVENGRLSDSSKMRQNVLNNVSGYCALPFTSTIYSYLNLVWLRKVKAIDWNINHDVSIQATHQESCGVSPVLNYLRLVYTTLSGKRQWKLLTSCTLFIHKVSLLQENTHLLPSN